MHVTWGKLGDQWSGKHSHLISGPGIQLKYISLTSQGLQNYRLFIYTNLPQNVYSSGDILHLSRDARKPVFEVSDQLRHKRVCTATEDS